MRFGKGVEQFADRSVATCVVWDSPSRARAGGRWRHGKPHV
jgi:hypothetical protein